MRRHSDGRAGELAARLYFNKMNWVMQRTQPEARIIRALGKGQFVVVFSRGGVADFTGFNNDGEYVACEVKEASGDSMQCSVLDRDQRMWMASIPACCAWVGIYWTDHGEFRVYPFKNEGSYKRMDK